MLMHEYVADGPEGLGGFGIAIADRPHRLFHRVDPEPLTRLGERGECVGHRVVAAVARVADLGNAGGSTEDVAHGSFAP